MKKILEMIQDHKGKLSSTRILFLFWGFGMFFAWVTGSVITWQVVAFTAALGGVKIGQNFTEAKNDR